MKNKKFTVDKGIAGKAQFTFDPYEEPYDVKPVIFLKGSWYEMGYQFGQFAPEFLQRIVVFGYNTAILGYGTVDKCEYISFQPQVDYIMDKAPQLMDYFKGIAAGTGYELNDILLGFLATPAMADDCYTGDDTGLTQKDGCSNLAVWGEATADGKLIAGSNTDAPWLESYFGPAVVYFPEDGNVVIGHTGYACNTYLNDKGVCVVTSSGEGQPSEGDFGIRLPYKFSELLALMACDNAKDAAEHFIELGGPGMGQNLEFCDTTNTSYVVEHTASKNYIRRSGDFGEKNKCYTLAANDFRIAEMQSSRYTGDHLYDDCYPRYWTEEKVLLDNWGKIDIDTVDASLGMTRYYIPENYKEWLDKYDRKWYIRDDTDWDGKTGWSEEIWDAGSLGMWPPENRHPSFKCISRTVIIPEDRKMYMKIGGKDNYIAQHPYANAQFCTYNLTADKGESINAAKITQNGFDAAELEIWKASKARYEETAAGKRDVEKDQYFDMARQCYFNGVNLNNLANIYRGIKQLEYYGLAASEYCRAEVYAKMAQAK